MKKQDTSPMRVTVDLWQKPLQRNYEQMAQDYTLESLVKQAQAKRT